jgi:endonuclease/exonuclease/phosphatase (EEP) superfamily protein YafD
MRNKYNIPRQQATRFSRRKKIFALLGAATLATAILLVSACIRIPEGNGLISHRKIWETMDFSYDNKNLLAPNGWTSIGPAKEGFNRKNQQEALDSDGFTLVSWNVFKGKKEGWPEDFKTFIQASDILTLQEAYLTNHLREMLHREDFDWDMTQAFEYKKTATGVLTAARTAPSFTFGLKDKEPIIRLPKSILISKYSLSGTQKELMVANVHGINFSMGQKSFKGQLDRMEAILAEHEGPIIVSGDFNTWSADRISHVTAMAQRIDLAAVRFEKNHRSRLFGYDIDHIYYRGLRVTNARTPIVSTSDHNPLTVTFKLKTTTDEKD